MKSIGIVICNYNKKKAVLDCIESVLESRFQDFDIYVVDNASSDGSAEAIKEKYNNKVRVIENSRNLGGSGGFNTGLRIAIEQGYKYLVCLDNDVLVDENAIYELYSFLESHDEVGMVGSRVYHMEEPDYVQQFGLNIDFKQFCLDTLYENHIEDGSIPEILYCDAVATCCMMARSAVIREIGVMPEENFIYWDDIEWGYLCNRAGYKVAVYGASKVLHTMGAKKVSENTFATYYMWRNWIRFFIKYTTNDDIERMSLELLRGVFYALYDCSYREEHKLKETITYAFSDAMNGITGIADEDKIFIADRIEDRLGHLIKEKDSIYIDWESYNGNRDQVVRYIKGFNSDIKIIDNIDENSNITKIMVCESIFHNQKLDNVHMNNLIFLDRFGNSIITEEDRIFANNYELSMEFFIYTEQPIFLYKCKQLRNKISENNPHRYV
ncbi:glycosyltransferase family 2 protein [Anaeromicropila herbilytica]|uniref:Glycosyl transferase n=1 Tax=Anaeromicropila herbilytica TaxID=2785025 RepID=A0A7R7EJJ0_9FIRM|nr:glycosyltransferase family 2 protein [Anaeromicropila herbilytica]BCN29851.1 glycosyl transferase [Anaeromicropila herbilytica]